MVSKDDHKVIIWPIYFDKSLSRLQGRRISKKLAIDKPDIEKIAKVAKSLGLSFNIEKNASHPSKSWKREGRLVIEKIDNKNKLLLQIAKLI
jgi:signal recognition particle subunit SRP19